MQAVISKYTDAIQYSNSDNMGYISGNYSRALQAGMIVLRRNPVY